MKKPLFLAAVNLAGIGLAVLLIELVFGSWLKDRSLYRLNLVIDRTVFYDVSAIYTAPYSQALYRRDRFGLRSVYPDPSAIDILTIGGSATDQRFISEGYTWQDVMRKEWEKTGRRVSVVNAGVDGQSTYGHIKNFDWWFPKIPGLHSRYILCYIGVNDLFREPDSSWDDITDRRLQRSQRPAEEAQSSGEDDLPAQAGWRQQIEEKSAIYYVWRTFRGLFQAERVRLAYSRKIPWEGMTWTNTPLHEDHAAFMQKQLLDYEQRLRILLGKISAAGAKAIFVTQAAHYFKTENGEVIGMKDTLDFQGRKVNGVDLYSMHQLLNQTALRVCREGNCIPIDLAGELTFADQDFYDYYHNTPAGAEKIGRYLAAKLTAELN